MKFMGTAMFVKSALAMLITIGFAGGVVYYGTSNGANSASDSASGQEVELRAPQQNTPQRNAKTSAPTTVETVEAKTIENKVTQQSEPMPVEHEAPKLKPDPKPEPTPEPATNFDLAKIMPLLMQQAEKISTVEIKDQAYLDIVNFSVSQRQFKFADAAMLEIDQTELRDTARSQIAIGLALEGRADEAFEVIDAVEIGTLRDVMRLQVIEALIIPEKLPPGFVRP